MSNVLSTPLWIVVTVRRWDGLAVHNTSFEALRFAGVTWTALSVPAPQRSFFLTHGGSPIPPPPGLVSW